MQVTRRFVGLCTLLVVQLIFAFGFYDASVLFQYLYAMPAYLDTLHTTFYYPTSAVGKPGFAGPFVLLNVLTAIVSLAILAFFMKSDNECVTVLGTHKPLSLCRIGATRGRWVPWDGSNLSTAGRRYSPFARCRRRSFHERVARA